MSDIKVTKTQIPGFYVIDLDLREDDRGYFKENYQKEKLEALGLPHFEICQNNVSYNKDVGATRGLHAEPWEKYVSITTGKAFCAWADLRKGPTFGQTFTLTLTPDKAVLVPRGVANGYQSLEKDTVYIYLVNDFWSPDKKYQAVNLFDPALNISWPIPRERSILSDKDKANPMLSEINPMEF